jgi:hypothetical protein
MMEGFKMGRAYKVLLSSHVKELKRQRDLNKSDSITKGDWFTGIEEVQTLYRQFNKKKWRK